jgi:hypothetical protein
VPERRWSSTAPVVGFNTRMIKKRYVLNFRQHSGKRAVSQVYVARRRPLVGGLEPNFRKCFKCASGQLPTSIERTVHQDARHGVNCRLMTRKLPVFQTGLDEQSAWALLITSVHSRVQFEPSMLRSEFLVVRVRRTAPVDPSLVFLLRVRLPPRKACGQAFLASRSRSKAVNIDAPELK